MKIQKIKKTGQQVFTIAKAGSEHTLCLFPFTHVAKSGNRGVTQVVKNSNIEGEIEELPLPQAVD